MIFFFVIVRAGNSVTAISSYVKFDNSHQNLRRVKFATNIITICIDESMRFWEYDKFYKTSRFRPIYTNTVARHGIPNKKSKWDKVCFS